MSAVAAGPLAGKRILVAKPGLDGHDAGAKVIALALRDAGAEVIYTGLRKSPEFIVRVAIENLAAVLGGAQSILTCAYDEAFQIPTEFSAEIALRTQQIVQHESGVAATVDPLGGSYYVEWLTDRMEGAMREVMGEIDAYGGVVQAIEEQGAVRPVPAPMPARVRALQALLRAMVTTAAAPRAAAQATKR